jgi:hypothetical protein
MSEVNTFPAAYLEEDILLVWHSAKSDRFILIIRGASIGSISYMKDEGPRVAPPTIAVRAKVE